MGLWQRITEQGASLRRVKRYVSLFLVGVGLSVAIASCGGGTTGQAGNQAGNGDVNLTLVSFAVTRAAHDEIIPRFVEQWRQEHNQNVTFNQSYGGSGSQTRAVIDGLKQMLSI